jgi:ectoine hydroxylase-related dioxygenase (phytanoyl-CoA dioxygenase family)
MYYPRSHREPLFEAFTNYPQTNLRTAPPDVVQRYNEYAVNLARQYQRHLFVAKKGDVLFWHGMLLHGGSEVKNPKLTRRSFVIHYIARGMDAGNQVVGPFNW